jgi:hypothetical protein
MIPEARRGQNDARDRTSAAFSEYEAAAELCGPYFNSRRTALPSRREALPLIRLDFRMLRSFVSVVQTGSITVTARQLGRAQPAIALQLQRL